MGWPCALWVRPSRKFQTEALPKARTTLAHDDERCPEAAVERQVTCPWPYGPHPCASCSQPCHPSSSQPWTCRELSSLPSFWWRRSSWRSCHPSVSYELRCRDPAQHKPATRLRSPERLPIQTS